jgi:hypothetical protein
MKRGCPAGELLYRSPKIGKTALRGVLEKIYPDELPSWYTDEERYVPPDSLERRKPCRFQGSVMSPSHQIPSSP